MKISDCTIKAIKDRAENILENYGVHLQRGKALCPFHPDKKASFVAKRDKAGELYWSCMACGVKGRDILSFVAQIENLNTASDFPEVVSRAAAACGLSYLIDEDKQTEPTNRLHQIAPLHQKQEQEQELPRYFDREAEAMAQEIEQTNLYKFLCRIWEAAEVKAVMEAYKVGRGHFINKPKSKFNNSEDWSMNPNPCRLQNSTACNSFPSIDTAGHCHAVKIIPYPATDHHRIKNAQPDKAELYWIKPEQNPGAYFGIHLLPLRPTAPVAVVESEKTALIGSLFAPAYIWIATQSKGLLSPDSASVEVLRGRELHLFPDADGMKEWRATAGELTKAGYKIKFRDEVIRHFPTESKIDIADVIVMEMERRGQHEA